MPTIIAILSIIIAIFFIYNLQELIKKIKKGKTVNSHSLLATSALIFHFISLTIHFLFWVPLIVIISQIYMLGCLIYLFKKK